MNNSTCIIFLCSPFWMHCPCTCPWGRRRGRCRVAIHSALHLCHISIIHTTSANLSQPAQLAVARSPLPTATGLVLPAIAISLPPPQSPSASSSFPSTSSTSSAPLTSSTALAHRDPDKGEPDREPRAVIDTAVPRPSASTLRPASHSARRRSTKRKRHSSPSPGRRAVSRLSPTMQPGLFGSSNGEASSSGGGSSSRIGGEASTSNGHHQVEASSKRSSMNGHGGGFKGAGTDANGHTGAFAGPSSPFSPRFDPIYPGSQIDREELVRLTLQCLQDTGYS